MAATQAVQVAQGPRVTRRALMVTLAAMAVATAARMATDQRRQRASRLSAQTHRIQRPAVQGAGYEHSNVGIIVLKCKTLLICI